MSIRVLNEYPGSHHYFESYEKNDKYYCPNCGLRGCWIAASGDYYVGSDHVCTACSFIWSMPCEHVAANPNEVSVVEQLKSGVAKTPTTKRGN